MTRSPQWLQDRLIARGDIPRNNIVDASNFVLFELGQPTHVFDLAKLQGPEIIIRFAKPNEPFLPIGEGAAEVKLQERDLVIADAQRAVAIAGVKGGALTAVSNSTTDILIEAATFAPASVRTTSRRLGISSDSAYRFERGVHPGQIERAAHRLVELILELCGGKLCEGTIAAGQTIPPQRSVSMRPDRCRAILGIKLGDDRMIEALNRLGFQPKAVKGAISCTIPYERIDIEREIDLIEEIARMIGLDEIPISQTMSVRIAPPQSTELAKRAINDALAGAGFIETVTHSLVSEKAATAFMPPGMNAMRVADERAKAEPVLRPSIIPSLLRVLAFNRDRGVEQVSLFESASTFASIDEQPVERMNLALVHCAASAEQGLRELRGVIDRLVHIIFGPDAVITVAPEAHLSWLGSGAGASVRVNGEMLGVLGVIAKPVGAIFDLDQTICAAELGLPAHYHLYPPETQAHELPHFPAIQRDVSAIVDDRVEWVEVKSTLLSLQLQHVETIDFVTTFRGKQIGAGKKSLTIRARFRAPDRTLKHDEVDPQIASMVEALQARFAAEIRK
jgi:phenylalanyl-tRNA synthetase beta chain